MSLGRATICVVLLACAGSTLSAQVQWQNLGPSPIAGGGLTGCYDSARGRFVVYGGSTWEFDGSTWSRRYPSQQPTPAFSCGMAYDPIRQQSVLFGDANPETWTWNGNNWTLAATSGPAPRVGPALTWNDSRGTVMLFGGDNAGSNFQGLNDLWEWNGTNWTQIPATTPPPVGSASSPDLHYTTLTYDPDRQVLVVFGAWQPIAAPPWATGWAVTWEWDPTNGWQNIAAGGPSVINFLQVFDAARRRTVVFGRDDRFSPFVTYERDGGGPWVQRTTATTPIGPLLPPAVYDSTRHRSLLIGWDPGTNVTGTFAYSPTLPARYELHGAGCAGTSGMPSLAPTQPWSLPWLGDTLAGTITNLPTSMAIVTTGFSDTSFGSLTLPLDLGALGLPGCLLRCSPLAPTLVSGAGGIASFSLPIPNISTMRGLTFFQQALVLDPAANPLGATLSNSIRGVVGTK